MVEQYAALGDHRTGTKVDHDTSEWFCAQLECRGATVSRRSFDTNIYQSVWYVNIDGREVASLPLFYEGVGRHRTTDIARDVLTVNTYDAVYPDLQGIIESARKCGRAALVVATKCANDSIYAINRIPQLASGLPTLLVPGRVSEELAHGRVEMELEASIVRGQSCNVIGCFGSGRESPILITTPLSGWFECAGERGTGIAVALSLAQSLAAQTNVMLVATSGHELGYEGAWQFANATQHSPRLVVHIGASVAACERSPSEAEPVLTSGLELRTNLEHCAHQRVVEAMSELSVVVRSVEHPRDANSWSGESSCWARFGAPMVSFAGDFPLFHTPEDTPENATTPALLTRVDDVLRRTIRAIKC